MNKIIGRNSTCDFVILDPQNRVSRRHAEAQKLDGVFYIKDLNSLNGTFINGIKIVPGVFKQITGKDKVTLSNDYPLDIRILFNDEDATKILSAGANNNKPTMVFENNKATFRDGNKVVEFDRDKTQIGDILEMDNSPFLTVGRNVDNKIVINNSNISRYQCKIRLITPVIIEVEDLGSTNGSFADEEKLIPNKKYQFASSVKLRFGNSFHLDLKKVFPNIHIIQKFDFPKKASPLSNKDSNTQLSKEEINSFNELEAIWKEYIDRQNQGNNVSSGYAIGGAVLGLTASILTGGVLGIVAAAGGGILGRYLGQQKSSQIRNDLTYEDAFLQTYACPRCMESFQKKPWITIRECYKCKSKFR